MDIKKEEQIKEGKQEEREGGKEKCSSNQVFSSLFNCIIINSKTADLHF